MRIGRIVQKKGTVSFFWIFFPGGERPKTLSFEQIEPFLAVYPVPAVEDLGTVRPHYACTEECRIGPTGFEIVVRRKDKPASGLQQTGKGIHERVALLPQKMLQGINAEDPVEGPIGKAERQAETVSLDRAPLPVGNVGVK